MPGPAKEHPTRSTRRGTSDLPFIFMMSMLVAPLLWGAIYVLFLDLEGQTKAVVAVLAVVTCAPLVAVIIYVLIRPLPPLHQVRTCPDPLLPTVGHSTAKPAALAPGQAADDRRYEKAMDRISL